MSASAGRPRVAVVYNEPALPPGHPDSASEADVVDVARAVTEALEATGLSALPLGAAPPLAGFVARLSELDPDAVFNLAEGFGGPEAAGATFLTAVFELLEVPYTGSDVVALAACQSKSQTKALLRGHGLPTARSLTVRAGDPVPDLPWPGLVLVKPDGEDGSLGIDQGSVVGDGLALRQRVERLRSAYGGAVLIESYLPGPEFNVGLVAFPEVKALPVARVAYTDRPGAWPILTYTAKWDDGSEEDRASPVECPARIDPALAGRLAALAESAFRAVGCRDYARVDLRLDANGDPMVLEVNPNPDVGPDAGWARALRASGASYNAGIAAIAGQALGREQRRRAAAGS